MDAGDGSGTEVVLPSTHALVPKSLNRRPRILSLDGGGIRGFASLLILKEVMRTIARRSGQAAQTPLPCQYFDLIGGTSTGGLIAIMLGRLRMVFVPCLGVEYNCSLLTIASPNMRIFPRRSSKSTMFWQKSFLWAMKYVVSIT
jgi:hypothetical protein